MICKKSKYALLGDENMESAILYRIILFELFPC